jgi:poly(3-hydroxybutyrate) depolymerase
MINLMSIKKILGNYNIVSGSITTSGISSGAVMATQFHVVHSTSVNGVGIFAGGINK